MDEVKLVLAFIMGVVGAISVLVTLYMHYRTTRVDRSVLKVSVKLPELYRIDGNNKDENSLEIELTNHGRRVVRVHGVGIQHQPERVSGKISLTVTRRSTFSTIDDEAPVILEEAEKRIISLPVSFHDRERLICNQSYVFVIDSLGCEHRAELSRPITL